MATMPETVKFLIFEMGQTFSDKVNFCSWAFKSKYQ